MFKFANIQDNTGLIYRHQTREYLLFSKPLAVIFSYNHEEVMPLLIQAEKSVREGKWAAGFLSYEAVKGIDSNFCCKTADKTDVPLIWFGIYNSPEVIPADSFRDLPASCPRAAHPPPDLQSDTTEELYKQNIARIKDCIRAGDTYQINYTFRMRGVFLYPPFDFFCNIVRTDIPPYSAYIQTAQHAVCSFSPELFFEKTGSLICSKPMKGTSPRGLTSETDRQQQLFLQESLKDRAENVMIADMMRNDLGKICRAGSVKTQNRYNVERFGTVWQMTTGVEGITDESISNIFRALFPAASVTGAPKYSAVKIIDSLETAPRGIYTGTIGYMAPPADARFSVAIRTLSINRQTRTAVYGTGSGVVWDSDSDGEYEEVLTKTKILSARAPDFELLETMTADAQTGEIFLWDLHLKRLMQSADYFGFRIDTDYLNAETARLKAVFTGSVKRIRLTLNRNGKAHFDYVPLKPLPVKIRCAPAKNPVKSSDVFLYHKTTHRKVYDEAAPVIENVDDIILWNERGEVTETRIGNLVFVKDGIHLTPPVSCGLLAGTYREWLLNGKKITEAVIRMDDLRSFDRICMINSVRKELMVEVVGI